jgi:hypothetical protein
MVIALSAADVIVLILGIPLWLGIAAAVAGFMGGGVK